MRVYLVLLVTALMGAWPARAQEVPVSTIETEGMAVVDTLPTYVEFWLHVSTSGESATEAVEAALRFEPALRKELQTREMTPSELSFTGIAIPDVGTKEANVSARLRFSASTFTATEDEGARQFAQLCDKIIALIGAFQHAKLEGPALGLADMQTIEDSAIARATEKAYPAAKAAALIMNGQIIAVDKVVVETVVWNKAPGVNATQPDIRRVSCTAKVRVTYTFTPSQS